MISLFIALVGAISQASGMPLHAHPPVPTPIGTGVRYRLSAGGPAVGHGVAVAGMACRMHTPRSRVAHVELFARGRVLIIPPGIGIAAPRRSGAIVTGGRCRYPLWTDDPTGVVHVAGGDARHWHRSSPCGANRSAPTICAGSVRDDPWSRTSTAAGGGGRVGGVPLRAHAEIVVEIGRRIAPHAAYLFPEGSP